MLGCRFSFQAYAKNVQGKAINGCLKTTEVLLDAGWTCAHLKV